MNSVESLLVLAGVLLVPVLIAVAVARLRPSTAEIVVGVFALVVIGVGLAAWGIDAGLHPSAAGLGRTITTAPVPPGAEVASEDIRDGDIESQPQASMSYVLPGSAEQECVAVVQTYLDARYRIYSANTLAGTPTPVVSAATLCADGYIQPGLDETGPYLEMAVCKGEGKSGKCFRAIFSQRTADENAGAGSYAPTGNSELFLEA